MHKYHRGNENTAAVKVQEGRDTGHDEEIEGKRKRECNEEERERQRKRMSDRISVMSPCYSITIKTAMITFELCELNYHRDMSS